LHERGGISFGLLIDGRIKPTVLNCTGASAYEIRYPGWSRGKAARKLAVNNPGTIEAATGTAGSGDTNASPSGAAK